MAEEGGGEGAGGGVRISPVGYLTSDGAEIRFHDISNWRRTLGILLLVFLIGRFLGRRGRGKHQH